MKSKIAFCCSASKDYIEKYKKCIESQISYCKKYDIDYFLDSGPLDKGQKRSEWYWRKVYNIIPYFENYDYVCIVDCDLEFTSLAEDIRTEITKESLFYVLGISKRPNSGFLIIKSDNDGKNFIDTILKWRGNPLPAYAEMKGENGYVIQYIKENPANTKEIPLKWNCSQVQFKDEAYVLHYTNQLAKFYDL